MPSRSTGRSRGRPPHPGLLTPAEERVLERLRDGLTDARIAERLGISPDTVHSHISHMLSKLGLHDRRALAAWQPPEDGDPVGYRLWFGLAAARWRKVRGVLPEPAVAGGLALTCVVLAAAAAFVVLLVREQGEQQDGNGETPVVRTSTASPTPAVVTTTVPAGTLTPTTTRVAPTASPTSQPTLSPIPDAITGHPKGTRTGEATIDAVLDAIEAQDIDALTALVEFAEAPCLADAGPDGHAGPVCREGEPVGTMVEYFVVSTCAPVAYPRPDEVAEIRPTLRGFLADDVKVFAAYEMDGDRLPSRPGRLGVIFAAAPSGQIGTRLYLGNHGIVHANSGCSEGPGAVYRREVEIAPAHVILPPAPGTVAWLRELSGGGADVATDVAVSADGGVLLGGFTRGPRFEGHRVEGESDVVVARIGDFGLPEWVAVDGLLTGEGLGADEVRGLAIGADGRLIAVGSSALATAEGRWATEVTVWLFDPTAGGSGGGYWRHTAVEDRAYSVGATFDGSVYVAGEEAEAGGEPTDMFVAKHNEQGAEVWRFRHGGGANDAATDVAVAADGSVYVLGVVDRPGLTNGLRETPTGPDLYLAHLSPEGLPLWERTIVAPGWASPGGITVDEDGSLYVVGSVARRITDESNVPRDARMVLARYDSLGDAVWTVTFDSQGDDAATDVALFDDRLYVAGTIFDTTDGGRMNANGDSSPNRLYLAEFTLDGDRRWVQALPLEGLVHEDVALAVGASGIFVAATPGGDGRSVTASDMAVARFFAAP
jgi:DNA-binding CsgD family transcriptional regulator